MILIAPERPSALRSLGSKLFGRKVAQSTELTMVEEHEIYLAGLWDQSTSHSPVEFTGTLQECEQFMASKENSRKNCQRWKQSIRPTGELIKAR